MRKSKVLISGGSGFIGKNIIESLGEKYNFFYPTHRSLDLLNPGEVWGYFKTQGPFDAVIHCASVGGKRNVKDKNDVLFKNLSMFFNIANCKNSFGRMILCGSGAEYGRQQPIIKIDEKSFGKNIPSDYYGFSKFVQAKFVESSVDFLNLRIFGLFGKYEDTDLRFISYAIKRCLRNLPIVINKNRFIDYVYISNFIKILDYFLTNEGKFKSYNIGSGRRLDLKTISRIVRKVCESKSTIIVKSKGLQPEYTSDNSRLLAEIPGLKIGPIEDEVLDLLDKKKYL